MECVELCGSQCGGGVEWIGPPYVVHQQSQSVLHHAPPSLDTTTTGSGGHTHTRDMGSLVSPTLDTTTLNLTALLLSIDCGTAAH